MQNRVLIVGSLLLAAVVAVGPVVDAQTPQHTQERTGRCFTPVTTGGVYFLVTAGGPTEQILRAAPPAPPATRHKVTHSMPHSQIQVTATARVRVPGLEPNFDGELWSRMETPPAQPPAIHTLQVRHTNRHASAFGMTSGESVDVVLNSAIGTTGCRLRLR